MAAGNAWSSTGTHSVRAVCNTGTEAFPVPAKATVTVQFQTAVAGNTVTLKGVVFTATAAGGDNTGQNFSVGANDTATGDNFVLALARTKPMHGCTGENSSGTVTVTAGVYGPAGHYGITKVGNPITLGAAALAGGVSPVGVNLQDVGSIIAQAYATTAGQTITGGNFVWGYWHPSIGVYMTVPNMQDAGPSTTLRGITLGASSPGLGIPVLYPNGYLAVLPSSVTVSGGSTITIDVLAFEIGPGQVGRTM